MFRCLYIFHLGHIRSLSCHPPVKFPSADHFHRYRGPTPFRRLQQRNEICNASSHDAPRIRSLSIIFTNLAPFFPPLVRPKCPPPTHIPRRPRPLPQRRRRSAGCHPPRPSRPNRVRCRPGGVHGPWSCNRPRLRSPPGGVHAVAAAGLIKSCRRSHTKRFAKEAQAAADGCWG